MHNMCIEYVHCIHILVVWGLQNFLISSSQLTRSKNARGGWVGPIISGPGQAIGHPFLAWTGQLNRANEISDRPGSCTSQLQLKVNCRLKVDCMMKLGLARRTVSAD